ncbi:MAG: glycosyltransferase family 39 protein [Candidatus Pacearchaeota archaeon]
MTPNNNLSGGDLAMFLNGQMRVVQGDTPYKDFWTPYGALESYFPAFIFKNFGQTINAIYFANMVICVLVVLASFILALQVTKSRILSIICAALFLFNGIYWRTFYYIHAYMLFLLLSTIFLFIYFEKDRKRDLVLVGVFTAVAFLFKIEMTGAYGLALFFIILTRNLLMEKKLTQTVKELFLILAGFVVPFLILILIHPEVAPYLYKDMVLDALDSGTSMNLPYFHSIGSYFKILLGKITIFQNQSSIFNLFQVGFFFLHLLNVTLNYLLPFVILPISIIVFRRMKLGDSKKIYLLFFIFWFLVTFPKSLGRSAASQLSHALMPLFFVQVLIISSFGRNLFLELKPSLKKTIYLVTIISLLLSATIVISSSLNTVSKTNYKIETDYGTIQTDEKESALETNQVISLIYNYTKSPEDYIFVSTQEAPPFYTLTNRKNPTYYSALFDVIIRPSVEKQNKMCQDLADKKTKIIIHDAYWGYDQLPERQFLHAAKTLHDCIINNFEFIGNYGRYQVYISKD